MNRILQTASSAIVAAVFCLSAEAADLSGPELTLQQQPQQLSAAKTPSELSAPETASPLKVGEPNGERSDQLEQVARQVDRQIQHGFELAGRGAFFAAKSEFLGGLKLIAEALDTEQKTDAHGRALAAAMIAMTEAEDFLPNGSRLESNANLARVIATHTTPVLKTEAGNVTAMTALKCYLTFAQEQYSTAAGHEVSGSMALYALGKLHNAMAQKKSGLLIAAENKAMVYYQAAMLVDPNNFMAANDLGVLLAQCGNYAEARVMLEHSLSLCQQSATWHNLAVVYGQLGQPALARQADGQAASIQQAEIARQRMSQGTANNSVQWIDSQTFAKTSTNSPNAPGTIPSTQKQVTAPPANVNAKADVNPKAAKRPSSAERMFWGPAHQR